MLLSPEALLRHPLPYTWPLHISKDEGHCEPQPLLHETDAEVLMLSWSTSWPTAFDPFIERLRAHRLRRAPAEFLFEERDDSKRPPFSQAVIYLANNGYFFDDETPSLEASGFGTGIEDFFAVSFMLTGPKGDGPTEWMITGSAPDDSWIDCKKCLCVVFLLAPGSMISDQWKERIPQPHSQPDLFLPEIIKCCEDRRTRRAAVTDGHSTIFLELFTPTMHLPSMPPPRPFYIEAKHIDTEPAQLCVAWLIYEESRVSGLWNMHAGRKIEGDYLGALNAPSTPLPPLDAILKRGCFSDFDIYTMKRDRRHWDHFLEWKAAKLNEAETHPLRADDILVAEKNSFVRHFFLSRSPLEIPTIPPETMARILHQSRPKDAVASVVTNGFDGVFSFQITGIVRAKRDTYSQVFCGFVQHDGVQSKPLCLKLYDERLFVRPYHDDQFIIWEPAEDLARREESAYDRLKLFQGSVIPHSYGCHHFTLPDGHRCIGFLMEFINGVALDKAGIENLPEETQKEFFLTVRHCLRVLCYAQIEQTDWHVEQLLILPKPKTEVVFIDFAFSLQHHDPLYTPPTHDWIACKCRLYNIFDWDTEKCTFIDSVWFEPDENEY